MNTLKLTGFNNLSKSLALSIYKVHFVDGSASIERYKRSISNKYNAEQLKRNMESYAAKIGGAILHTSTQNYQPQGASVNMMIAEGNVELDQTVQTEAVIAHLDKSHLCIHTYPEEHFYEDYAIFRADIEVSTCGVISPLQLIKIVFEDYNPDVVFADYRVRGLNRFKDSANQYIDHDVYAISEYLSEDQLSVYSHNDQNLPNANLFHSTFLKDKLGNEMFNYICNTPQSELDNHLESKAKNILRAIYNQS